jgi:prolyl 4-hydroxylase
MDEPLTKQAARAAYGWGRAQDWEEALRLLAAAAKAGQEGAARQLELVTQAPIAAMLTPPAPQRLSPRARVAAAPGFAPPGFSQWLIDRAEGRLEAAKANDATGEAVRTARTCAFGPQERDLVLAILQVRAARLLGVPVACHEPPNAISYEPGQEYRRHADFIEPSVAQFQMELAQLGQRVGTVVTYLNEDFDGAETVFPDLDISFRGQPGDAIFFANVLTDGSPDYLTSHAALPPTRGRKWVLSQWIRARPFPYSAEALA